MMVMQSQITNNNNEKEKEQKIFSFNERISTEKKNEWKKK